jgi:hypothetical protein
MVLVESGGIVAALPQVSAATVEAVDVLGEFPVSPADRGGERPFALRCENQVDVVGHQTVAEDGDVVARAFGVEEFEVAAAVIGREEDVEAVVAAVRNVVRHAGNDDAGDAGHALRLAASVMIEQEDL